jgi:hypothetical protein
MKRQKSFEQKLSSVVLLSLFSVGIFPTVTSASEELNSNGEIGPISLENIVISEENHLIPDISETSQTINSIPVEELTNPENQIIWSDLDLTQSEINSENEEKQSRIIELENQLKNHSDTNNFNQNIANPESFNETDFSSNINFNLEPISLEEALKYEGDSMAQVNSVSQLRDVSPNDWAYDALRNLVENYDCLEGYPDRTFRGNRAMTRYEFAAGLNACLDRINFSGSNISSQDLDSIRRLVQEFEAEIATLGTRVDDLEGRVAFLEDNQFSTTTKLFGQVIVGIQGRNDNDFTYGFRFKDGDTQINTITNTQLSLFTQFGPRSILLTGLSAGSGASSINGPALGNFVRLGYEGNTNNDVQLSDLTYRHLVSEDLSLVVGAAGVSTVNVFRGPNRVESAGFGPLSRFAQRNPVVSVGAGGAGAGFDWQLAEILSLQGVYSTGSANNPTQGGLFGGDNGTTTLGVQLVASPTDNLDLTFQYVNAYSPFGFLGTFVGDDPVVLQGAGRAPINTDAFGGALDWRVSPQITLGGWVGYTASSLESDGGSVDTFNWMSYLTFPDLFAEGNLGAIFVGQPPKITESNLPIGRNVPDFVNNGNFFGSVPGGHPSTSTHIEAFYRFKVNDNISITPGFIIVLNPGHNSANDTITIGAIRTTLSF